MSGGEDALAGARRELGLLLADLREAAGLSQRRLGPLTGYSAAAVAKAESGRQSAGAGFWSRADEVLHADGALVRGHEKIRELQRAASRERRVAHVARAAARLAKQADGLPAGQRRPEGGDAVADRAASALVNCPHCGSPLVLVAQRD